MSVLDEVAPAGRANHPRRCLLQSALEGLPEEADEFRLLIFDPRYAVSPEFVSAGAISAAFKRRNWPVSDQMISRHRLGKCRRCYQVAE